MGRKKKNKNKFPIIVLIIALIGLLLVLPNITTSNNSGYNPYNILESIFHKDTEKNNINDYKSNDTEKDIDTDYNFSDVISIANWNLQIFGTSKAGNKTLMDFYAQKMHNYDIIFVQEIRDSTNTAFIQLCSMFDEYKCINSTRAGRSSSKEQYGIIYKKGIEISDFIDYNLIDENDRWERAPIKVDFVINQNYTFTVYNIHTKPDDVKNELKNLYDIAKKDIGNVMIIGDLNADCTYYNNKVETEFDDWIWLIKDDEDTTVAKTDCAYDRIIVNNNLSKEIQGYGIYKDGIVKEISDHYLVYAFIIPSEQ